ncbi:hypothetical protein CLOM_g13919 [Closterium sp. NIES-68]|nr:hypothetical protein CLOM_g13919 [Closterium sp. NIES-68]GJP76792.1 hypothetical protein CLOP_g7252 [Closterium sp. NIES-67]
MHFSHLILVMSLLAFPQPSIPSSQAPKPATSPLWLLNARPSGLVSVTPLFTSSVGSSFGSSVGSFRSRSRNSEPLARAAELRTRQHVHSVGETMASGMAVEQSVRTNRDPREIVTVDEAMAVTVWKRKASMKVSASAGAAGGNDGVAGDTPTAVAAGASDATDQVLPIKYHGGKLMTRPITVYLIFYGSWRKSQMQIVKNFVRSLSNTSATPNEGDLVRVADWWRINTWYTQKGKKRVTSQVHLGGAVRDRYSQGKVVSNDMQGVWNIVAAQLANRTFPRSSRAQYLVLSSSDVRFGSSRPNSGFCRTYCGWHSYVEVSRKLLKYAFVGNAEEQCPSGCRRGFGKRGSANGWRGVDGMVSIVGHEIAEAATNPRFTGGWFDDDGEENADKCQLDFGPASSIKTVGDSYAYNMVGQGGMRWLIQSNWRPGGGGGGCVLQGPSEAEVEEWEREARARAERRRRKRVSGTGLSGTGPTGTSLTGTGLSVTMQGPSEAEVEEWEREARARAERRGMKRVRKPVPRVADKVLASRGGLLSLLESREGRLESREGGGLDEVDGTDNREWHRARWHQQHQQQLHQQHHAERCR